MAGRPWVRHRRPPAMPGCKADAGTALVEAVAITPGRTSTTAGPVRLP